MLVMIITTMTMDIRICGHPDNDHDQSIAGHDDDHDTAFACSIERVAFNVCICACISNYKRGNTIQRADY